MSPFVGELAHRNTRAFRLQLLEVVARERQSPSSDD